MADHHDQGHDHHHQGYDHHHRGHAHPHTHAVVGSGHNRGPVQWQVPHRPEGEQIETPPAERDLDLVEKSFIEGFVRALDSTSFLRLSSIPFVGVDASGRRLHLLRVETESLTDVGALAPLLGGQGVRYDPLPAKLVAQRQRLSFVYHDGRSTTRLDFAEARKLADESGAAQFTLHANG
jgi:hypothetical protein